MQISFERWVLAALIFLVLGCGQEAKIVEVEPPSVILTKFSQTEQLKAKAKDLRDKDVPGVPLTYSSENPAVATVDSSGVVKSVGNGNTAILVKTPSGVTGEAFVKVCLPGELVCQVADGLLKLRVGTAAPIKCHVNDCKGEPITGANIEYSVADKSIASLDTDNIYIGLLVGNTEATVKVFEFEKRFKIQVDEAIEIDAETSSGGGKKDSGKPKEGKDNSVKSNFEHILKNMNFK